jgi:RNA polymerase sigma factor (sigma-70 family)
MRRPVDHAILPPPASETAHEGCLELRARSLCGPDCDSDLGADCVQEARICLWQAREKLENLPPRSRERYSMACVRNAVYHCLKRERRQRHATVSLDELQARLKDPERADLETSPAQKDLLPDHFFESLPDRFDAPKVISALAALPARLRRILDLHFIRQLTDREIAVVLDTTPGAVKVQRAQAIARLRRALAGGGRACRC